MRRLTAALIAGVVMLLFATAAQAQQVTHSSFPISGSNIAPAGTQCDVAVKTSFTGTVALTVFGNEST